MRTFRLWRLDHLNDYTEFERHTLLALLLLAPFRHPNCRNYSDLIQKSRIQHSAKKRWKTLERQLSRVQTKVLPTSMRRCQIIQALGKKRTRAIVDFRRHYLGSVLSINSMSVPSGSSMKAISAPPGLSLKGSSVIVTFSLRSLEIICSMSSTSNAMWSKRRSS